MSCAIAKRTLAVGRVPGTKKRCAVAVARVRATALVACTPQGVPKPEALSAVGVPRKAVALVLVQEHVEIGFLNNRLGPI